MRSGLKLTLAAAALVAGPVVLSASPVSAGLTDCHISLQFNNNFTKCDTPNAGNPYPENEQRAKATCNGTTWYGAWVGEDVWSESPGWYNCSVQTTNNTYQKR